MAALAVTRRHRARLSTALATIVALGATGAACDGGDDRAASPAPPTIASPTASTLTCGRAAPDGGAIEVIESGFSVVSRDDDHPEVSYGVVLENTSTDHLAILTLVVVQLTDADGNRANDIFRTPPTDPTDPAQAVHTIFPGQQMGIGDQVRVDREGAEAITVEVRESSWFPMEQVRDVGAATATDIDVERIGTTAARIGFEVRPSADPRQSGTSSVSISDAQSWAIFRDADGTIVGGGLGSPGTSWNGLADSYPITGFVQVSRVPAGAVESSTQVHVSPLYPPYTLRPC